MQYPKNKTGSEEPVIESSSSRVKRIMAYMTRYVLRCKMVYGFP